MRAKSTLDWSQSKIFFVKTSVWIAVTPFEFLGQHHKADSINLSWS